jgi:uncharacterized damage-inducible protein DinB
MMTHPLVTQLRFTRSELLRALDGMPDEDALRRLEPMNCISWMLGHLANQEHYYWVLLAQGKTVVPGVNDLVGYGKPASTPPLADMWTTWHTVTQAADPYLDTLTPEMLQTHFERNGKSLRESIGTMLQRVIYHYWYHIGEALAVRQLLGHSDLPEFVGDLGINGPYRPE